MADIKLKNTANTEFSISHNGTRGAKAVTSDQIVVAVETINDFPAIAETGDTVIVKDMNRGGTFKYDATKSAVNNGGTIFNGWCRQYDGAVNVKWFGAKGDGITSDVIAIRKAIDYAKTTIKAGKGGIFGNGSIFSGTSQKVFFPSSIYKVDDYLTADTATNTSYLKFIGENSIIVVSAGVVAFGGVAYSSTFESLVFRGGGVGVSIKTANVDTSVIKILKCEFNDQTTASIRTDNNSASTLLLIDKCKFNIRESAGGRIGYFESGDKIIMSDCWVSCFSQNAFYSNCVLTIENMLGVPGGAMSNTLGRWIDFYGGSITLKNSRFGGEYGGSPIIYNYVNDLEPLAIYPFIGRGIYIDGCSLYVDSGRTDEGIIVSKDGLPSRISITNSIGPVDAPVINDQQVTGTLLSKLSAYTASHPDSKKEISWVYRSNHKRAVLLSNDVSLRLELARYFPIRGIYEVTATPSTSGSITLDPFFNSLSYKQEDGLVTINGRLRVDSVSSPVGSVNISLPWAIPTGTEGSFASSASLLITNTVSINSANFGAVGSAGNSTVNIFRTDAIAVTSNSAEQFKAGTVVFISFSYRIS